MKPLTRLAFSLPSRSPQCTAKPSLLLTARHISTTPATPATVSPIHGTGPPPSAPQPAADSTDARLSRRRKQAELLSKAQEIRSSTKPTNPQKTPLSRRRFWKDVHVKETDGALEVHLDTRPLRRPDTKEIIRLPISKPLLAAALALEWDLLVSVQQASKHHLIPLTSLICRALDIADDDATRQSTVVPSESLRTGITRMLMRYLDTDSLLCWAPPPRYGQDAPDTAGRNLRELQKEAAEDVVGYLTTHVWPGVEIEPVLDAESIMPKRQKPETRRIIEGWIMGLDAFEIAGLERAVLAGKGLLGAVRLLVEWSEGFVSVKTSDGVKRFGVEEAAKMASIEVDWQIGNWGEVEDTHDVQKEDLRRQLGSAVLLVTGTGNQS
ncbi:hypothetical protein GGR57DRAFT_473711 [Xylariaceae sp. FL1272]|nr:hypothetical protein GGR57DRAFT_473711 [Xylariaceae sp. FL1272]